MILCSTNSALVRSGSVTATFKTVGWLLPLAVALMNSGCQPSVSDPVPTNSEPGAKTSATGSPSSDEQVPVAARASSSGSSDSIQRNDSAEPPSRAGNPRGDASGESEAIEIVFEDIQLPIQADMVFRPFMMTERVKELDGKRIRIHGYMLPDSKTKGIKQFVLLKNTECKFGPGGQADHLINVLMTDGVAAKYRDDPISVEGVLKINPFQGPDGNTWSIYDLACDLVETYRPRR
jgi:hypothetical protein